jgi:serine/threonine protein phosphatase 1
MRTLVIGDIHGALKSLQDVLIKCNYDVDTDRLIFLGDYVDGWGESAELVDYLLGIYNKAHFNYKGDPKVIFIRGNHDNWCQDWLNMGHSPIIWTEQGGKATLESYVRTGLLVEQSHKDFFNNLLNWYIDENNNIFIHGGWDYKSDEFPTSALYPVNAGADAKECHWDRSLLKNAAAVEIFAKKGMHDYNKKVKKALDQFNKVFIGHTATSSHLPEKFYNLWNIDSGCGWSGKLTVMDVDTEEYWQSEFSKEHYPDEKGR